MAIRELNKSDWTEYLNQLTKSLIGKRAEIEVASLKLGDQIETEWVLLLGIAYDHKDDIIEVALDGVDHLIHRPTKLYVDDNVGGLVAMEMIDGDGIQQIVKLRDPLMLPPPQKVRS